MAAVAVLQVPELGSAKEAPARSESDSLTVAEPKLRERIARDRFFGHEKVQEPVDDASAMEHEMHGPSRGAFAQPCLDDGLANRRVRAALLHEALESRQRATVDVNSVASARMHV